MAQELLRVTFEDDSLLILKLRKSGGFLICYEDSDGDQTKLLKLSEEIDFSLAKSLFFMVADRWGWTEIEDEYEEDDEDDEDGEEDEDEDEDEEIEEDEEDDNKE